MGSNSSEAGCRWRHVTAAIRLEIVGSALAEISRHGENAAALFDVLETQRLLANPQLTVTRIPAGTPLMVDAPRQG